VLPIRRPKLVAFAGFVLITIFFLTVANLAMFMIAGVMNFMTPAAQLGIVAVPAALLVIGGGFVLSIGLMIALSRLVLWRRLISALKEDLMSAGLSRTACGSASMRSFSDSSEVSGLFAAPVRSTCFHTSSSGFNSGA
jgi:ribose/xylose/arabinose/galactoside ABC-type transport system permease subunit